MLIKIHPQNPRSHKLEHVVSCLQQGGVIIYPTDTVYGIGCDIFQARAVERICRIKGIDPKKAQFSFICQDLSHLADFTKSISTPLFRLLKRSLPGPFTFILPAGRAVPRLLKTRKETVGIRVPDNLICQTIVEMLGHPIMSSSLPADDHVEAYTDPEVIESKFGAMVDMVVDGGPGGIIPSTVVDCTGDSPQVLRAGAGELSDVA